MAPGHLGGRMLRNLESTRQRGSERACHLASRAYLTRAMHKTRARRIRAVSKASCTEIFSNRIMKVTVMHAVGRWIMYPGPDMTDGRMFQDVDRSQKCGREPAYPRRLAGMVNAAFRRSRNA